jgi:hypothetical protein
MYLSWSYHEPLVRSRRHVIESECEYSSHTLNHASLSYILISTPVFYK